MIATETLDEIHTLLEIKEVRSGPSAAPIVNKTIVESNTENTINYNIQYNTIYKNRIDQ